MKLTFGLGRPKIFARPTVVVRPSAPAVVVREDKTTEADLERLVAIARANKPEEVPTQEGWEKMIELVAAGMVGPNR